jgi:NitT/TauT family transport system substrate-binding protein
MLRSPCAAYPLLFVLAACGESGGDSTKLDRVRVGIIPIVEVAPLYIGLEKGYFETEGIHLELIRMAGGAEILPGVGSGSIDIGFSNIVSLAVFHVNRSQDFVAFVGGTYETSGHVNHALVARAGTTSGTMNWPGAIVGVNTRNNIEELMLLRYLKEKGIRRDSVNLRAVPFPAMESGIENGDLTMASLVEPFISRAQARGFSVLDNQYLLAPDDTVMVATYVTRRQWIRDNEALARRFQRAFVRASDFLNEPRNEQEVRSILASYTSIPPELADKMGLPLMLHCVDVNALSEVIRDLPEFGFLEALPPVEQLLSKDIPRCG